MYHRTYDATQAPPLTMTATEAAREKANGCDAHPSSLVADRMEHLRFEQCRTHELMSTLESRLNPLLIPMPEPECSAGPCAVDQLSPALAPLCYYLDDQVAGIRAANARLSKLLDALAV